MRPETELTARQGAKIIIHMNIEDEVSKEFQKENKILANFHSEVQVESVISVEDHDLATDNYKVKAMGKNCTEKDRVTLNDNKWLTDEIINAAQNLLKNSLSTSLVFKM